MKQSKMPSQQKIEEVKTLTEKISKSEVIGLVSIGGIPSRQFQQMRKSLQDMELQVTKNNLMKLAFQKTDIKGLDQYIEGSTGLIFSKLNPFKLKKVLDGCKTTAPVKQGSIAPNDITVPAGETSFPAGPIIGDLQKSGIKAKIQSGKIVITEDSLVAKEGDVISADLANILSRLKIEPMEIGLNLYAVYESGMVYPGDLLVIDEDKTIGDIQKAYQNSLNMALNLIIYNPTTIGFLLRKASDDARNLGINAEIVNKETIKTLLLKANSQAAALQSKVGS